MVNIARIEPEMYIFLAQKRTKTLNGHITKGSFLEINDIYLSPSESFDFEKNKNETTMILPFIGDLKLKTNNFEAIIDENKGLVLGNLHETDFQVLNEYENDTVNFLFVDLIQKQSFVPFDSVLLNIASQPNVWHTLGTDCKIGQWEARKKGSFQSKSNESFLIYCLSGVFELENRLLEAKDSLEIQNVEMFMFEALANNSILLFFKKYT